MCNVGKKKCVNILLEREKVSEHVEKRERMVCYEANQEKVSKLIRNGQHSI